MTRLNSPHKLAAAAAFGAAALFSMLSFGSNAEAAKSVTSCQGTSAGQVISCCKHIIAERGRPFWMIQTGGDCRKHVKCEDGHGPNRCYIVLALKENGGNDGHNEPRREAAKLK